MPTYEYVCAKCNQSFELFQSMTAEPLTTCPKDLCCKKTWGKGKVKRGIGGGAGLIFKGSGFYITDYRSDSYKAAAQKESGSSSPSTPAAAPAATPAPAAPSAPSSPAKAKKSSAK